VSEREGVTRGLRCRECGWRGGLENEYSCPECFGPLEVAYDLDLLRERLSWDRIAAGPPTLWRYADLLPCAPPPIGLPVGLTPLVPAPRLAERLGIRELWIKNDTANPTHSFKDRVVAVALARAREVGISTVACASTGNLANAVSAHAAAGGLESYVFIPADLEHQKVIATAISGAHVVAVDGNYDDVNRLCAELAADRPWGFVNVNLRPYYSEGSKTIAYEVAEQLGRRAPDRIVVPVASGSLYTKIHRGFRELAELGLVREAPPVMTGAQALGCSPVAAAFAAGRDVVAPVRPDTIAKSLAIGNPADGPYALDTARATGGSIEAVDDEAIVEGIALLAETTGIFAETAGGVATAVLAELAEAGAIGPDERVVLVVTGDGLKTIDAVADRVRRHEIEPTIAAFEAALASSSLVA
jgi:threonine synthase